MNTKKRYELMLGAISRTMIDRLFSPESRARPTKSLETSENVCARMRAHRPGPRRARDQRRLENGARVLEETADEDQQHETRDREQARCKAR